MKSNKIETLLNEVHSKILVPKQTRLSTPANGIAPQVYLFVIYFLANIHVNLTKKTRFVKIRQFFKNWFHEKTFFNRNKMLFISSKIPEVKFLCCFLLTDHPHNFSSWGSNPQTCRRYIEIGMPSRRNSTTIYRLVQSESGSLHLHFKKPS